MARRSRGAEFLPKWGTGPLTVGRRALLSEGTDRQFRQMIHALVGYGNCVVTVRDGFAALLNVTGVQYEILMVVYRLHGARPCSVGDVAAYVRRSIPFVTIELNKLVVKGLVEKQPDFTDRRRVLLRVTAKGVRRLNDIVPIQRRVNDALFEDLSAADFRALCKLYEKLAPCGLRAADLISILVKEHVRNPKAATA
ncbi:MAG: MarR family winged helix-turn-helix transcriptional regulator [Alphaproteobacteria bacterium]